MLRLAFRNLFRQKLRASLTLGAVSTGVAALILAAGFVEDALFQLRESVIHSQLGHLQLYRAGFSASGGRNPYDFLIDNVDEAAALARSAPYATGVLRRLSFSGLLSNGRADLPVLGEGVEPGGEAKLGTAVGIVAGRQLRDADLDGVLIGEGLSQSLRVGPGDRVTILASSREGALNTADLEVVGVFRSSSREFDAAAVRLPLRSAQDLVGTEAVNAIVVSLDETANTPQAQKWLQTHTQAAGLEVKTWDELADFYNATAALYRRQFGVLQFIILVLVVFGVASSVNMSAFERIGEFGTMMAAGTRRSAIVSLLVTENFLLGLAGSIIGAAFGVVLAAAISWVGIPMPPPPNSTAGYTAFVRIVPVEVAWASAIGVAAVLLAAILPARRLTRTPIVEALQRNV